MQDGAMILVSFRLDVEQEAPFSEFYHHRYIPDLMRAAPAIRSARRYQEHHVTGSLKYYRKQFVTLLECDSVESARGVLPAMGGNAEWQQWRSSAIHDLDPPCVYRQRWAHPRTSWDGNFGSRPFFMVSVELRDEQAELFHEWYEQDYLPKNVADVPSWIACRRYSSEGRAPVRHVAIYEAFDLAGLDASLDMMRAPFRMSENMAWKRWDTGDCPAITWEDAATYKPIFRRP
ncbi:hypothetical protein SAMN02990966_01388 [Rhodospirillales bacterium URHD0017]|nr:hypothetical protein SAMN02990966_01388 [Rhodospirillales bacterium URHD0017]